MEDLNESTLPPNKYASISPDEDGWVSFEKPILFVYAGQGPYVSLDLMQFPASLPNDGYIDVVIQERVRCQLTFVVSLHELIVPQVTRSEMIAQLDDAVVGGGFWKSHVCLNPPFCDAWLSPLCTATLF